MELRFGVLLQSLVFCIRGGFGVIFSGADFERRLQGTGVVARKREGGGRGGALRRVCRGREIWCGRGRGREGMEP